MHSLAEVARRNFSFACVGSNFITPLFRELTGQFPYEVNKYTIYGLSSKQRNKKLNRILSKDKDSFVVILRDEMANLEDVLFVPSMEIINQFDKEAGTFL